MTTRAGSVPSSPNTTGKISWFGGPNDKTTGQTTASGAPITNPGIAVYNRATLGGWWLIKLPNGVISFVKQTDIGPAPSTGRTFDFTYSLLHLLGYSQSNFPTNAQASGVYLGKDTGGPNFGTNFSNALTSLGADPKQQYALIAQMDAGAGKALHAVAVGPNAGHITAAPGVSTALSGDAASAGINVPNPVSGIDAIANLITSGAFWLRVGECLAGALLVLLGLNALTGGSGNPVTAARKAATVASHV